MRDVVKCEYVGGGVQELSLFEVVHLMLEI